MGIIIIIIRFFLPSLHLRSSRIIGERISKDCVRIRETLKSSTVLFRRQLATILERRKGEGNDGEERAVNPGARAERLSLESVFG